MQKDLQFLKEMLDKNQDLAILIPSFNEGTSLKFLIKKVCKKFSNIIVVDDHSNDNSIKILNNYPVKVIRNKKRLGYEKSLNKGFKYIKNKKYNYLVTFDADGQHKVNDIERLIKKLKKNDCTLIVSERDKKQRLFEYIFCYFVKKKFKINDPLSGLKAINLKKINKYNDIKYPFKYSGTYILLYCLIKKLKIESISIKTKNRDGKSKYGNIITSNFKLLNSLLNFYFLTK